MSKCTFFGIAARFIASDVTHQTMIINEFINNRYNLEPFDPLCWK